MEIKTLNNDEQNQINKIALIIAKYCNNVNFDDMYDTATALYRAGYRKNKEQHNEK